MLANSKLRISCLKAFKETFKQDLDNFWPDAVVGFHEADFCSWLIKQKDVLLELVERHYDRDAALLIARLVGKKLPRVKPAKVKKAKKAAPKKKKAKALAKTPRLAALRSGPKVKVKAKTPRKVAKSKTVSR